MIDVNTEALMADKCADCGESLLDQSDEKGYAMACPKCGSNRRSVVHDAVVFAHLIDGYWNRAKHGKSRPYLEDKDFPHFSFDRQKLVRRQQVLDRDNDWYCEIVTDYQTGEVLHKCEEPLSEHYGHGAAKPGYVAPKK